MSGDTDRPTAAPAPEGLDVPSYGNALCRCGHTSARHACDREASDDSCLRCDCDGFRAVETVPAPLPANTLRAQTIRRWAQDIREAENQQTLLDIADAMDRTALQRGTEGQR